MKNSVLSEVVACGSLKNRCFGGTYRLHHQDDKNQRARNSVVTSNLSNLMMKATFPRDIGSYKSHTVSHTWRWQSSYSPPWNPQKLYSIWSDWSLFFLKDPTDWVFHPSPVEGSRPSLLFPKDPTDWVSHPSPVEGSRPSLLFLKDPTNWVPHPSPVEGSRPSLLFLKDPTDWVSHPSPVEGSKPSLFFHAFKNIRREEASKNPIIIHMQFPLNIPLHLS
jgi:hypothetical protein